MGRIKTLDRGNDRIVSYAYMGNRTKAIHYPEPGVVQAFGHDALGRVEQVRSTEGIDQTILDFIYTYDDVGNRNTVKYNHLPSPVWDRYYYDTLNRLWKVEYAQTSGFALMGRSSLSELAVIAAEWLECECDFTQAANRVFQAQNHRKQRLKESIEQNGLDAMVRSHPVPFEHWIVKTETDMDAPIYALAELGESKADYRTEACTDEDGKIIAQIAWDSSDRMILFAMYPDIGGTVVVSMGYDSQGNVISNIFTILDADGKITETIDMLAYQAQQELEQKQQAFLESLTDSRTLDGGGMAMMAMSSPESPATASEIFLYDHLGNRYQETAKNGFTYTYSHNPVNQYSKRQGTVMGFEFDEYNSHDDNGNLEFDEHWNSYTYDYRNRLTKVEDYESNIIAEYAFDAMGRRFKKTVDGTTTYFIYDPQGRVIAEYEQDTLTREFVYGNGFNEVLAMFLPEHEVNPADWEAFLEFVDAWLCIDPNDACYNGAYDHNSDSIVNLADFAYFAGVWDMPSNTESNWYYLHDALGSVRGIVGGRFNRESDREFYNYDVYGKSTDTSAVGNPFRFASYRYDAETGLYHTPHRAYNPETGRWLQFDPINTYDSMNLYEYAISNPALLIDPYGLFSRQHDRSAWTVGLSRPWSYFSQETVQERESYRRQKEIMDRLYAEAESFANQNKDYLEKLGDCCGLGLEFAVAVDLGIKQGTLNTINGIQDAVIAMPNMFVGIYNSGIWLQKQGDRLGNYLTGSGSFDSSQWDAFYSPYIPLPDWSKDMLIREGDFVHGASKFLGGTGATTLAGVWIGKISAARNAAQGANCASKCGKTETVQRWMSKAELEATKNTGLLRGGKEGTHYVTDYANHNAIRARQRLSLPQTPEVRVKMEISSGRLTPPTKVEPNFNMPGGGLERTATGDIQVIIIQVQ